MTHFFSLVSLGAGILAAINLVTMFATKGERVAALVRVVVFSGIAGYAANVVFTENENEEIAREAGYDSYAEQLRAQEADAFAACRQDLRCIAETNMVETTINCERAIERMAKYDYEWTGTTTTDKFSKFKWQDQETGVVTYWGDRIKFQNGFGAWSHMIYECDINPEAKMLLDVRVTAR